MISVRLKGLDKLIAKTEEMNKRLLQLRTPLGIIALKAHKNIMQHFEEEKGPKKRWQRWSRRRPDGTRQFFSSRPYGRGGSKLLQDIGRLKGSIRTKTSKDSAEVYTTDKTAKFHQWGTKKMVKRPFMWVDGKTKKNIISTIRKYIFQEI